MNTIELYKRYLEYVGKAHKEGEALRDAIELTAMGISREVAKLAIMAIDKYHETLGPYSALSKQKVKQDEKAFASMGFVWRGEELKDPKPFINPNSALAQTLYMLLKSKADKKRVYEMNQVLPGAKDLRKAFLDSFFSSA